MSTNRMPYYLYRTQLHNQSGAHLNRPGMLFRVKHIYYLWIQLREKERNGHHLNEVIQLWIAYPEPIINYHEFVQDKISSRIAWTIGFGCVHMPSPTNYQLFAILFLFIRVICNIRIHGFVYVYICVYICVLAIIQHGNMKITVGTHFTHDALHNCCAHTYTYAYIYVQYTGLHLFQRHLIEMPHLLIMNFFLFAPI